MKKKNLFVGLLLASAVFSLAACTDNKPAKTGDKTTDVTPTTDKPVTPTSTGETPKPTQTSEAPKEKFTVSFESNGGSAVADIIDVESGSKISKPADPTKEATDEFEYEFIGWFNEDLSEAFDFENTPIVGTITLYAKWNEVIKPQLTVNKTGLKQFYQIGDDIDLEGISFTLKTADGAETLGIEDVKLNIKEFDSSKLGEYTIYVTLKSNENYTTSYKVFVCEEDYSDYQAISTAKEFNDFRYSITAAGKYMLTNDIDLDGIELAATTVTLMGEFNGNGHTIANAIYRENASVKTGILTKYLGDGAVVTNVRFDNCVADQALETLGIISGMGSGNITVSKVQFSGCSVTCNNYAGFILGRIDAAKTVLTMSEITCKNGCKSNVSNYGGTLIGDVDKADKDTRTVVNIFDCDLDIELTGSNQNGGFLSGRLRSNTNLNIENVVIRNAVLPAATGLICGGGDNNATNSTVTVKNLYVANTNAEKLQSCALQTGTNPVTSFQITYTNSYMNSVSLEKVTDNTVNGVTYFTGIATADATVTWLDESLNLDFGAEGKWTLEENDQTKFRLVASSTNVKSDDAKIARFKVTTANAVVRFEKGTKFDPTGLAVTGIYSDGVNLPLTLGVDYELDTTAFNMDAAGIYEIIIKSTENPEVTATYSVEVVEQTGFVVDTQFAKLAYFVGDEIDLKKLLVYSTWTDGKTLLTSKYTTNSEELDLTTAGAKELIVSMVGFDDVKVRISVVDTKPIVVDNHAYINVDANANVTYAGEKVNGVETFNTINEAVEYLVSADLDADVNKVMYIAAGTYHEKITIPASLKNLKIVGESRENSIIEYDAVEDTVDPITGAKYVMNCATLHVEAEGFGLENITVNNSFDYKNLNTKFGNPQGFALTINADGAVIDNVTLYGNQDTLFFKKGRVYLKDSTIMGNIDFIFGENDGIAFFDQCKIVAVGKSDKPQSNNGYVTAMKGDATNHPTYGYVFYKCELTDDGNVLDGAMSLGRPWGAGATVTYIECSFSAAYSTAAYGTGKSRWYDMSGNKPQDANFAEYGSTGDGAITEAVVGGSILTKDQADNYTPENTFAAANGGVTWTSGAFDYASAYAALKAMAAKTAPESIEVASDTVTVYEGGSFNLNTFVKPWNANNKEVTYVIGNTEAISYNNGIITGLKAGESTTITLTCGSLTKVINVTVAVGTFYEVQFITDGTAVATQTVLENESIEEVETTLAGCKFAGWYKDEAYTEEFDVTSPITESTKLYAKFLNLLTYAYNNAADGVRDDTSVATANSDYHTSLGGDGNVKSGDDYIKVPVIAANGYLQFNVKGYTKSVTIDLMGSTSGTNNETSINAVAYDAAGNALKTETFVLCKSKINTRSVINLEADSNIAYVRIVNTYTKQIAILTAEVTYERNATEKSNTFVTFGNDGNADVANAAIDLTGATISDPKDGGAKVAGTITVDVKAGGVVYVSSYQYYANFSIKNGETVLATFEKQSGYYQVTEDTTLTIESTGYLKGIYVLYQTSSNGWKFGNTVVPAELKVTLQKASLVTSDGLVSDATWSDGSSTTKIDYTNNGSYSQNNNHSFVLFVAPAGSTVTVVSYKGGISINGTAIGPNEDTSLGDNVTTVINVTAPQLILIEATSNTYLASITIA